MNVILYTPDKKFGFITSDQIMLITYNTRMLSSSKLVEPIVTDKVTLLGRSYPNTHQNRLPTDGLFEQYERNVVYRPPRITFQQLQQERRIVG